MAAGGSPPEAGADAAAAGGPPAAPEEVVEALEHLCDAVYGDEAAARVTELSSRALACTPLPEAGAEAKQRAAALGLRGRAIVAAAEAADCCGCAPAAGADLQEAGVCLAKAVKMDGSLVRAWCALGRLAWRQQRTKDALEAYAGALQADPDCIPALRDSARVLRRQGERRSVEEACERSKKAVSHAPHDGLSWYVHGMVLLSRYFQLGFEVGDLRSALKAFTVAAKKGEDRNPDLHMNRAQAERYLVLWQESAASLRKALAADPGFKEAREALASLTGFLDKLRLKWDTSCGYQGKALAKLLQRLPGNGETRPAAGGQPPLSVVGVAALPSGSGCLPQQQCVALRVLELVDADSVPLLYVAADAARALCCVAVYGYSKTAISSGAELVLPAAAFYHRPVPAVSGAGEAAALAEGDCWAAPVLVADRASPLLVASKPLDRSQWSGVSLVVEQKQGAGGGA
eukprot:TRINITY_DN15478_c0_g1_i1.p1 TRINITY_DN15478_c0_g1~~TRINITY_DN15478_c0_g1_i1.p1  ORF type:complete len:482 (+),score=163.30 TRINITY_DN15478_c0_g1_i1:67-1446(+)